MNWILNWLETKFSRHSTAVEPDERHAPVGVAPKENVKKENNASDHSPTLPKLASLEETSFDVIESTGFDPYDSGGFETSKSRSHR